MDSERIHRRAVRAKTFHLYEIARPGRQLLAVDIVAETILVSSEAWYAMPESKDALTWAATIVDTDLILATRLSDRFGRPKGGRAVSEPQPADAELLRAVRNQLIAMFEAMPSVTHITLDLGGNNAARLEIEFATGATVPPIVRLDLGMAEEG
jgi:hypothetical protein